MLGLGGVWAAIFFAIGLALVVRRLVGLAHAVVADGSLSRADLAIVLSAGALTVDLLSGWAIVRRLRAP